MNKRPKNKKQICKILNVFNERDSMTLQESSGVEQLQLILEKLKVGNIDQQDLMIVKTLWKSFQ
jgi:hypothetical protein